MTARPLTPREQVQGFTAYVVGGRYAGFGFRPSSFGVRLILGWLSIGLMRVDLESVVGLAGEAIAALDKRLAERPEATP
jgi:hypothetical protein